MAKRFKSLRTALKALRLVGAAPDSIAPEAPAGTQLRQFQQYKAEQIKVSYGKRDTASKPGELVLIGIKPFGAAQADVNIYRSSIATRSNAEDKLTLFGLTKEILGIETYDKDTTFDAAGFVSAKAICRSVGATGADPVESQITGAKYYKTAAVSYTFPFGKVTARPSVAQQKAEILATVNAKEGKKKVSFKPEKF